MSKHVTTTTCSRMLRLVLLSIVLCNCSCHAWKRPLLLHGRPARGLVPPPPAAVQDSASPTPGQWFAQRLDHFDPQNNATWQQRYFVNDSFWDATGGPVFLMLGGEGEANPIWLATNTDMMRNTEKFSALALMIEHRFYGKSQPLPNTETTNLRFLSSEQALADVTVFHDFIVNKYHLTAHNIWVSFGGSYSGALSAWLRIKYPHLIAGAVATSAPVQPVLNFVEYLEVVTASLGTTKHGPDCPKAVQAATDKLDAMLADQSQWQAVEAKFSIKPPLQNANDVMNLVSSLAGNFMGVVQYNRDNRAFEGATNPITIDDLCDVMTNDTIGDELDRYASVGDMFRGAEGLDVSYEAYVEFMRNPSWTSPAAEGGRQWFYQTCTEFGYYQTSDSDNQPFGKMFPLSFSVQQCSDIFGPQFNQSFIAANVQRTLDMYGGKNISKDTANIIFPNGSIDPWHALSILQSTSDFTVSVYIDGTAHCANMYPPRIEDLPHLERARTTISHELAVFLER